MYVCCVCVIRWRTRSMDVINSKWQPPIRCHVSVLSNTNYNDINNSNNRMNSIVSYLIRVIFFIYVYIFFHTTIFMCVLCMVKGMWFNICIETYIPRLLRIKKKSSTNELAYRSMSPSIYWTFEANEPTFLAKIKESFGDVLSIWINLLHVSRALPGTLYENQTYSFSVHP